MEHFNVKQKEQIKRIREEKRKKKERISNAKKLRDLLFKDLGLAAGSCSMDALFLDEIKNKPIIKDLVKIVHLKIDSKKTLWQVNGMCIDIIHS